MKPAIAFTDRLLLNFLYKDFSKLLVIAIAYFYEYVLLNLPWWYKLYQNTL